MEAEDLRVHCGCTPVVDVRYRDDGNRSPSEAIIQALSEAMGVDGADLPPVYEFVDLEAVDSLFENHNGARETSVVLSFAVDTWNVFVSSDGRIRVCDATRPTKSTPVFETTPS